MVYVAENLARKRTVFLFDFMLFLSVLGLTTIGFLFIYSSGVTDAQLSAQKFARQLVWIFSGFGLLFIMFSVHTLDFSRFSFIFYGAGIGFLLLTLLIGREVNGAKAWIGVGSFGIQPSEFMKLALIFFLATLSSRAGRNTKRLSFFLLLAAVTMLPTFIVLLQPDLGTAILYPLIFFGVAFVAGVRLRYLLFCLGLVLMVSVLTIFAEWIYFTSDVAPTALSVVQLGATNYPIVAVLLFIAGLSFLGFYFLSHKVFYWISYATSLSATTLFVTHLALRILKDFQVQRLIVFLDPYQDPRGSGWHIIQSLTAIGSGKLFGKGYLQGTQSQYRFLPEQSTDFIFSIIGEEWGFLGTMGVLVLYLVFILRGMKITIRVGNPFVMQVCAGITTMFFLHFLINIGMVLGVMPIVGIPLLFLSYGGSAMWTAMMGVGVLLGAYQRRYKFPLLVS